MVAQRQNKHGVWKMELWAHRDFEPYAIQLAPFTSQLKETHLTQSANAMWAFIDMAMEHTLHEEIWPSMARRGPQSPIKTHSATRDTQASSIGSWRGPLACASAT